MEKNTKELAGQYGLPVFIYLWEGQLPDFDIRWAAGCSAYHMTKALENFRFRRIPSVGCSLSGIT